MAIITPPPTLRTLTNIELLCANHGGLTLSSSPEFRKDAIADIMFLTRKRFIVTISKDAYKPGTSHEAKVTQTGITPYFCSATGAGEPMAVK